MMIPLPPGLFLEADITLTGCWGSCIASNEIGVLLGTTDDGDIATFVEPLGSAEE